MSIPIMSIRRTLIPALLATAMTALPVMAQTETPPPPAATTAVTVEGAAPVATSATRDRDTLSVDFPDEDIRTILRNVADLFELNLVVPDTLTGKTSIKLRDVTWRQIFQVVLSPIGYTYVEEGNIIKVVSNELLTQEPVSTDVFILNNAKAADIKPTVDGLVDPAVGGKIFIDARSNALVITERPTRMSRIRSIIEQLDRATDQVMIESKFVEVTDRDIRDIGVNWAGLQNFGLSAGQMTKEFERRREDVRNEAVDYGTSFNPITGTVTSLPGGHVTLPPTATGTTSPLPGLPSNTIQNAYGDSLNAITSAVFSASDFNVVLSALKSRTNTKVVSNPTVVTLNNSEAVLNIGQEFPIPSYTYNAERGTFEVSGFTYKPIGVILKVTPQVNSQGLIRLNLEPEISQQADETTFGGAGGAQIPIISTRKAKTQISLKNGYTVGIGGLLSSQQSHGGTKVPVLGSIPLLGKLFSSKSVNDNATNLLIFITAKTVNADGAMPTDIFTASSLQAAEMDPTQFGKHLEKVERAEKTK
ncbi:type II secretion system protein GspD [Oleiharenicola lentus]|uniref:type II secretion system protein GspD n=1 Tax=Oleiharenicola lentus TaxID=2508720 RepID=UPI003F67BD90